MASRFTQTFESEITGSLAPAVRSTAAAMLVDKPAPGSVQIADVQRAFAIKFGFDLSDVKITAVDVDLVFQFPDGSKLVLPGLALNLLSADPPKISFNETVVEPVTFFSQLGDVKLVDQVPSLSLTSGEPDKTGEGPGQGPGETTHQQQMPKLTMGGVGTGPQTSAPVIPPVESLKASAPPTLSDLQAKRIPSASPSAQKKLQDPTLISDEPGRPAATISVRLYGVTEKPEVTSQGDAWVFSNSFAAKPADTDASLAAQAKATTLLGTERSDILNAADFSRVGPGQTMRRVEISTAATGEETLVADKIRITLPNGFRIAGMESSNGYYEFETNGRNSITFDLVYDLPGKDATVGPNGYYGSVKTFNVEMVAGGKSFWGTQAFVIAPRTAGGPLEIAVNDTTKAAVLWSNPPDVNVNADAGDDTIYASASADFIDGGSGTDIVSYAKSNVAVEASLATGRGTSGYAAGDVYRNVEGLEGTAFADKLTGDSRDNVLIGGKGADTLDGGAGRDVADYSSSSGAISVDLNRSAQIGGDAQGDVLISIEDIRGSNFRDDLTGDAQANRLWGNAGNDTIRGGAGNDTLDGGAGTDTLDYSELAENDSVTVTLLGENGSIATVSRNGVAEADIITSFENVNGGRGNDHLTGDAHDNSLAGGSGDDRLEGRGGNDTLDGGSGIDTASYGYLDSTMRLSVALDTNGNAAASVRDASGTIVETDQLIGIENLHGGAGADTISGNDSANSLFGAGGNDELAGGGGDDTLDGGDGNDLISGGDGSDSFIASAGNDTLRGGDGSDSADYSNQQAGSSLDVTRDANGDLLVSVRDSQNQIVKQDRLTGIETIVGSSGNDSLLGDAGANLLTGGAGDDTLFGEGSNDTLAGEGGNDTADFSRLGMGASIALSLDGNGSGLASIRTAGVETGRDSVMGLENVIGSDGADSITGNAGANRLAGGAGNDTLTGGEGADTLEGGAGDDRFVIDDNDTVSEQSAGGNDTVVIGAAYTASRYDLVANVENIDASAAARSMTLNGNAFDNSITGGSGNDIIDGGAGADTMAGGAGDDTYYVDAFSASGPSDHVVEAAGEGTDTVITSVDTILDENVEVLAVGNAVATGLRLTGNSAANTIFGGAGNDTIDGGADADSMEGGAGDDTYLADRQNDRVSEDASAGSDAVVLKSTFMDSAYQLDANVETLDASHVTGRGLALAGNACSNTIEGTSQSDSIEGQAGDDVLFGGAGNDTIDGGTGADSMAGGAGNDTYVVDNASDLVDETSAGSGGIDTVVLSQGFGSNAYSLGAELDILDARAVSNVNVLNGNALANTIFGGDQNDTIDGGAGADSMAGGAGDDTYYVDEASDTVWEALNAGIDTVVLQSGYASAASAYNLSADVEKLDARSVNNGLTLTGNSLDNTIWGGAFNDTLDGGLGADSMEGGDGDDTYVIDSAADIVVENGNAGVDRVVTSIDYTLGANIERLAASAGSGGLALTGNSLDNTIAGAGGNDTLRGGGGNDLLSGGEGDDTYYVDSTSTVVTESANQGTDLVLASANYTLAGGSAVEILKADPAATSGLNLKGNEFANTIVGGNADDMLDGGAGNDLVQGGAGNDELAGGGGQDTLEGGAGDDLYVVDGAATLVRENADEGTDTVRTSADYALTDHVEKLEAAAGSPGLALTGNTLANAITGGAGNDTLTGGGGADTLDGGAGDDFYYADSSDSIVDSGGTDTVEIASNGSTTNFTLADGLENLRADQTATTDFNLTGNSSANAITGSSGNDTLRGGGSNDTLDGGLGNDSVDYGSLLSGQRIVQSFDSLTGIVTTDIYNADGTTLGETDRLKNIETVTGSAGADILAGNNASNRLIGNDGNDTFRAGAGDDTFNGGDGIDTVDYSAINGAGRRVVVTRDSATGNLIATVYDSTGSVFKTDTLIGIERVIGTDGNDVLAGTADADELQGGAGNDILKGDGTGDTLDGGANTDTADYSGLAASAALAVALNASGNGVASISGVARDTLIDIENVTGGDGNDTITGNAGANVLDGGAGDDSLDGGTGADLLIGGTGNDVYMLYSNTDTVSEGANAGYDTVRLHSLFADTSYTLADNVEVLDATAVTSRGLLLAGNSLANRIRGTNQNDTLEGAAGNDTLEGNDGDDTLDGGTGADSMVGGAGNDTYFVDDNSDVVDETSVGSSGIDTVLLKTGFTLSSWPLDGSNVENIDATALAQDLTLTGSSGANLMTGGSGNDSLLGGAGNDTLAGGLGNDTLDGGSGADSMIGGAGNDTYYVDNTSDRIDETSSASAGIDTIVLKSGFTNLTYSLAGTNVEILDARELAGNLTLTGSSDANTIKGGSGNDSMLGGAGNDLLEGGFGNDTLDGEAGADAMAGDDGNDIYLIDDAGDLVTESNGTAGGIDTIRLQAAFAGASYTLASTNVENLDASLLSANLTLTGSSDANVITGGSGNDSMLGGLGNDTLTGGTGNDTLDGGADADSMIGGAGNDVYYVDNAADIVVESSVAGSGTADKVIASVNYTLAANVENLEAGASGLTLTGNTLANAITGSTGSDTLDGAAGNDTLDGGSGDDSLLGGADNDSLLGGSGNDTLDGGTGNDTLQGGAGDDVYFIDSAADVVDETTAGSAGTDTVKVKFNSSTVPGASFTSYVLAANVEQLDASQSTVGGALSGNALANTITGSASSDTLSGGAGNDYLDGGAGNDSVGYSTLALGQRITQTFDSATGTIKTDIYNADGTTLGETDTLKSIETITGTAGNDKLVGDGSANSLLAGAGDDTFLGGAGNDTFDGEGGVDTLDYSGQKGVTLTLADNVAATASFVGGGKFDSVKNIEYVIGSQLLNNANVITGNSADNWIKGGVNTNNLSGGAGNDTLIGGNYYDTLNGGIGNDSLEGGGNIDYFVFDWNRTTAQGWGQDTIGGTGGFEVGADKIQIKGFGFTLNSSAQFDELFTLTQIGGASSTNYVLTLKGVAALGDTQTINIASTSWYGGPGNAVRAPSFSDFSFTAGSEVWQTGTSGNDSIAASTTNATLLGFAGDDTLVGGAGNDIFDGGSGNDTASYSAATQAVTVSLGVTGIQTTGGGGNDILINIENLIGGAGNDTMTGDAIANALTGGAGNDTLNAGAGNDTLDGGTGNDSLIGGTGNDVYYVDSATDTIVENAGEGTDTVYASANYTLGANVENLTANVGTGLTLTGNTLDNTITGGAGNDVLDGGAGNDVLTGGTGNDTYTLDSAGDSVVENAGEGTDTVRITVSAGFASYTLAANAENLQTANNTTTAVTFTGNTLANAITGSNGDDTFIASLGNDTITGGSGSDTVNYSALTDGSGNAVRLEVSGATVSVKRISDGVLIKTDTLATIETMVGTAGNDSILGSASIVESLVGGAGNDTLDGGAANAADTLVGGAGDDTFYWRGAGSIIGSAGDNDTVVVNANMSSGLAEAISGVRTYIQGTGTQIYANSSDNIITGRDVNETLDGGAGNDVISGKALNDSINGGSGNDTLNGDENNDTIQGGLGNDSMDGGADLDTIDYSYLTGAATQDVIIDFAAGTANAGASDIDTISNFENANGGDGNDRFNGDLNNNLFKGGIGNDTFVSSAGIDSFDGGIGTDTLQLSATASSYTATNPGGSYPLRLYTGVTESVYFNSVERLILAGYADGDVRKESRLVIDTSATTQRTLTLDGSSTFESVTHYSTLTTSAGKIDFSATGWRSLGFAGDSYTSSITSGWATYYLTNGTGTVAISMQRAYSVVAGSGDDYLAGDTNANALDGGAGNDSLSGGAGSDTLTGGADNDTLDGGAGTDSLVGGTGDDVYYVDAATDVVVENASEGTDRVVLQYNPGATAYTLASNVEILDASGQSGNNMLYGNTLDNTITGGAGSDTIRGDAGNDSLNGGAGTNTLDYGYLASTSSVTVNLTTMTAIVSGATSETDTISNFTHVIGGAGNDSITGNASANSLTGGAGNDTLDGGTGIDTLAGGAGDDTYYVDSTTDVVTENASEGTDIVYTSANFTLGNNIERLIANTSTGLTLTGNTLANTITGGAGSDVLSGGLGNDSLDGGTGNDTADYSYTSANMTFTMAVASVTGGGGEVDTLTSIETIRGGLGNDSFAGSGIGDYLFGNDGNDTFVGWNGVDTIDGGNGIDFISTSAWTARAITFDMTVLTTINGQQFWTLNYLNAFSSYVRSVEILSTSNSADSLAGDASATTFNANGGDDTVLAGGGDDTVSGGTGNDSLDGGSGNDTLDYSYLTATQGLTVTLSDNGAQQTITAVSGTDVDVVLNFENLTGGAGNDNITGNNVVNVLSGGSGGIDRLYGMAGDDTLLLNVSQIANSSSIDGGGGNDTFQFGALATATTTSVTMAQLNTLIDNTETLDFTGANNRINLGVNLSTDTTALAGITGSSSQALTIRYNASGTNDVDTINVSNAAASDSTGTAGTSGYTQNFYADAGKTQLLLKLIAA